MIEKIDIEQYWKIAHTYPLFDVRTPSEFAQGHIPGAHNIPLFTDKERVEVGTIYKQISPRQAMLKGLEFVGPKMRFIIEEVEKNAPSRVVAVHCWRGGKRSGSVGWLLEMSGFQVKTLIGGYKAYRNYVQQQFYERKGELLILGGKTGCGKTKILKALKEKGEQVIDLEGLAHHKGSAFGFIGEAPPPSVEQFENNLFDVYSQLDFNKRIWVENESKRIGKVSIPDGFWQQMKSAPMINLELPFEVRLDVSVANYTTIEKEELIVAFNNIRKRLGGKNHSSALRYLSENNLKAAACITLNYYDKQYAYMLEKNQSPDIRCLQIEKDDPKNTANLLIDFAITNLKN